MTDQRPGAADHPSESFGERLRRLRRAAGLSQAALAGDTVHASYVSLLESGRRTPTPEVLARLAARLGVTAAELAGRDTGSVDASVVVLAEAALGLGRPAEAVDLLEAWADRWDVAALAADPWSFRAARAYATALERCTRLEDAIPVLERLVTSADAAPGRLPAIPVLIALTRCYRNAGDLGSAIDVGERALARLDGLQLGDVEGYAALVSTLASAYHERGDLVRAQLVLDELVERTRTEGSDSDRAAAFWNAALLAADRGRAGDALRLVEEAAVLLAPSTEARWRAQIQVTRSWILLAQDPPRAAEARSVLRDAMPAVRQYAGEHDVASALENLARAELLLGRPEVARRHVVTALRMLDPSCRIERARALTVLGAASVALGEDAVGIESLESAADLLQASEAPRQAAAVWRQVGEVYAVLGDTARSLDAAARAMDALGVPREPLVSAVSAARPSARPRRGAPSPASARGAGTR